MKHLKWALPAVGLAGIAIVAIALLNRKTPDSSPEPTYIAPLQSSSLDADEKLKITIRERGMYLITLADLEVFGWGDVDLDELVLLNEGNPVSLHSRGQGEERDLIFYGEPYQSRYTRENVYFLTRGGNPAPLISENPEFSTGASPLTSVHTTLLLEENPVYYPRATDGNFWYWHTLPAPGTFEVKFDIEALTSGASEMRVRVFGRTEAPNTDPDHHLVFSLNGIPVADEKWDGIGDHDILIPIDGGILQEKDNLLVLTAPGDTGVVADIVLLDHVELRFPRGIRPLENQIHLTETSGTLRFDDFPEGASIYEVSAPAEIKRYSIEPKGGIDLNPELQFVIVPPAGFLRPHQISQSFADKVDFDTYEAAYLAIGPVDLLEPLAPLLAWHEARGLSTAAVPVDLIYDAYNFGRPEPEAVRLFLKEAAQQWGSTPRFLLLVGDATHDPLEYLGESAGNRMPSFFIETFFGGETVSDTRFALLDDDPFPDISVGRIPARTPEQVSIAVEKTLAYVTSPKNEDWQQRIFALADGQEASFASDAQIFLNYFSDAYTHVLLAPEAGATGVNEQIAAQLDEGALIMSYFGHGSITQLGKDTLFSTEDGAALMNSNPLPVMINITCLAGLFTHPEVVSLAETMMWNANGGAVTSLAATSLTTPQDQAYLTQAFVEVLMENPYAPLGEIVLEAQQRIPAEQPRVREVLDTFLLFGDPAMPLLQPGD